MANFSYKQYIQNPDGVLDAVARELNDDFELSVRGNSFEFFLYSEAANRSDYCISCNKMAAPFQLTTKERAERLSGLLPIQTFIVQSDRKDLFPRIQYGNLEINFTADTTNPDARCGTENNNIVIAVAGLKAAFPSDSFTQDILISACETLLINPIIGRAVASVADPAPEITVCGRLDPLVTAEIPEVIESGQCTVLVVTSHPADCNIPNITVTSSNPDIISVDELTLITAAPGTATIRAYIAGENKPFFTQDVSVKKTIRVSEIQIVGLDEALHEGSVIPLRAVVKPSDAVDAQDLTWESSDPVVATVKDGYLYINRAGSCVVKASTPCAFSEVTITAAPKLRTLKLSCSEIKTSVGHKVPVSVQIDPLDAFNAEYNWSTSDNSVAVVEKEDGKDVIKAIGIGCCILTCISSDGQISDKCQVTVESMMYKKRKKSVFDFFRS